MTRPKPSKEELQDLYLIQMKSDREIAHLYGISDVAVSKWRKKLGINTISQLDRLSADRGEPNEFHALSPKELASLYSKMGAQAIGDSYGVSKPTVRSRLAKFGIEAISKSARATSHQELTEEQQQICIGTILGDAHILHNGVLKITHYYGQRDYLLGLHTSLSPLVRPVYYEEKEMDNGQLTFAWGFKTIQHSWLQAMRSLFYPEGNKIYPESIILELTPLSLAYWYFDDGSLDSGLPSFMVGDLTDQQTSELIEKVGERFGLSLFESSPSGSCRVVTIRGSSADKFFGLIKERATRDLLYKIPPKHWPAGILPRLPVKTPRKLLPKHLSDGAKDWPGLDDDDKSGVVESFMRYWDESGFPFHEARAEELEVLGNLEMYQIIQDGKIKIRRAGQGLCQSLCSSIWSGHSYGGMSPLDIFSDRVLRQGAIEFCLKSGRVPDQSALRDALRRWKFNGVYNFRPSASKALIDRYCQKDAVVLDPCAGYGGRLLGALMSDPKVKYVGFEPATETYQGLLHLHEWVSGYLPEARDRATLRNLPAEEAEFPEADLILTSPPYWKREIYSEEGTQSWVRYQTYDAWINGFWRIVLRKSVAALRHGGVMLLNVDDFNLAGTHYSLINDTRKIVAELGLREIETLDYLLPDPFGKGGNKEVVICWSKGSPTPSNPSTGEQNRIELPRCPECGKAKPIQELAERTMCLSCSAAVLVSCKGCEIEFRPRRKSQLFHDTACHGRYRRKIHREQHPAKITRTFICQTCSESWETSKLGHFTICPRCSDKAAIEPRTKVCEYRYCNRPFVDTSSKNSMKFCVSEHRRREKLFRAGIAVDQSYFHKPDPRGSV